MNALGIPSTPKMSRRRDHNKSAIGLMRDYSMSPVVSTEEMRTCDEIAVGSYGIPGLLLMESAGRAVVESVRRVLPELSGASVVVFCGKGNNGGDGFVAARHLTNAGAMVTVVLFASSRMIKGDALVNFRIVKALHAAVGPQCSIRNFSAQLLEELHPDVVVDAIFGTGFSGPVPVAVRSAIEWMNENKAPVIAVDIPSGVNGTTGRAASVVARANTTVTMGALKSGLLCNEGKELSGNVRIADIGIPPFVYKEANVRTFLANKDSVHRMLPPRKQTVHKYNVGRVFVLAGSRGFTGAAALTTSAVLRSGVGAVILGTPESVYDVLARKLSEAVVIPLPATSAGSLAVAGIEEIRTRIRWADVTIIGPGLSQNDATQDLILKIVRSVEGKVVVDADGLNALGSNARSILRKSRAQMILTPHTGEFSRMSKTPSADIETHRIQQVRDLARVTGMVVVLKGPPTAMGEPRGRVVLNPTGNPGMATVGSGDVLAGVVGGLWAQGMEQFDASIAGVFLHGLSGDHAKAKFGERSIVAQDLIDFLPVALRDVEGSS